MEDYEKKINLVIAGFQKAGTTSIKNYLSQHPEIQGHYQEEMTYFSIEKEYKDGMPVAIKRYYKEIEEKKYLLAKHATIYRNRTNLERLKLHNNKCKIIVCLRNPVKRAYSSYQMEYSHGSVTESFENVIQKAFEDKKHGKENWHYNVFIDQGNYSYYINRLFDYFPKKNVYFLVIEEFYHNPQYQFNSIIRWLDLNKDISINLNEKHNSKKTIRNRKLHKVIKLILEENSPLKNILKQLIPMHLHNKLGKGLRNMNRKEINLEKSKLMNKNIELKLKDYYKCDINNLEKLLERKFDLWY